MSSVGKGQNVYVISEVYHGIIAPITFELIGEGTKLAAELEEKLVVVLLGNRMGEEAKKLLNHNVDEVIYIEDKGLEDFSQERYTMVLAACMKKRKPRIVLVGATSFGRELGPSLAYELNTDIITDCTELLISKEDKLLLGSRPDVKGNFMDQCSIPGYFPQMVSIRPGIMKRSEPIENIKGIFTLLKNYSEGFNTAVQLKGIRQRDRIRKDLTQSRFIISGGRGMKGIEGFKLLEELAEAMKGEVGCTRPCVDAGWTDSMQQIGQTGVTVKPDLYLAFGISGAIQHVTGINGSKCMIAVNKDEKAAIFEGCDYGVIGDAESIAREMINIVKS